MTSRALILGCSGTVLTPEETAFFRDVRPWGFILFRRNIGTPEEVRALTGSMRALLGRDDAPILIDQEGGRVQRMGPPHWPTYPAGARFGQLDGSGTAMARLGARLMAHDLAPVIKHIPGHGRAACDSHHHLPVVDAPREALEAVDFRPFRALADLPLAMSAHVVFTAIDPERPATQSATVIGEIVRGAIGFDGLLMTDDLSMNALRGTFRERAEASFAAGIDAVLHCNGRMDEMRAVVEAAPVLAGEPLRRAHAALARLARGEGFDVAEARARFEAGLAA